MMPRMRWLLLVVLSLVFVGCDERCVAGVVTSCTCADETVGTSTCTDSRTAGECVCEVDAVVDAGIDAGVTIDAGVDAGLSLTEFCDTLPAVACAHRVRCGDYSDAGVAVCLQREGMRLRESCRRVDAGTLQFDESAAAACLRDLTRAGAHCIRDFVTCGVTSPGVRGVVFVSTFKACGAATCGEQEFCDSDCETPTCVPYRQPGQSCGLREQCDPATGHCPDVSDGGAKTCVAFFTEGEACTPGLCLPGSDCRIDGADSGCVARLADGESCASDFECSAGHCRRSDNRCGFTPLGAGCRSADECGNPVHVPMRICKGLRLEPDGGARDPGVCTAQASRGDACQRAWAPEGFVCSDGLACLDGECVTAAPYSRPLGAECPLRFGTVSGDSYFGSAACQEGFTCQSTSSSLTVGRCGIPKVAGAACTERYECESGLRCVPGASGRVCTPVSGVGEPCTFERCFDELACFPQQDGGFECQQPGAVGGACTSYHFRSCVDGARCVSSVCEAKAIIGATCVRDTDCETSACGDDGRCVAVCRW